MLQRGDPSSPVEPRGGALRLEVISLRCEADPAVRPWSSVIHRTSSRCTSLSRRYSSGAWSEITSVRRWARASAWRCFGFFRRSLTR